MPDQENVNYKFISKLDRLLKERNRAVIDPMVEELTEAAFIDLVDYTAAIRGAYIQQYLALTKDKKVGKLPGPKEIKDLKAMRRLYEEMTEAFKAVHVAIERGYLTVTMD